MEELISENQTSLNEETDWSKCFLCQGVHGVSDESLVDPSKKTNAKSQCGYNTIAENVLELHNLNALPLNIDISRLMVCDTI